MSEAPDDTLVVLNPDVYDAVVMSAFGGVVIQLPDDHDDEKKAGTANIIRVHPLMAFGVATFLFMIQVSCITCLYLDIDVEKKWAADTWKDFNETPGRRILLLTRVLMIVVLQMICLKEFLSGMKPLLFVCNPITWSEMRRETNASPRLFRPAFCIPLCIAAECMQLYIAYQVSVLSMTVILGADSVSSAIFNGLVITFLTDLDEHMFTAMVAIFHIDSRKYRDFVIGHCRFLVQGDRVYRDKFSEAGKPWGLLDKKDDTPHWSVKERNDAKANGDCTIWLYRGPGGKVAVLENLLVFGALAVIFFRQILMFFQAVETGILPLKRDVCTLWRGIHGDSTYGAMVVMFNNFFTLVDYKQSVHNNHERFHVTDCYDPSVKPLCLSDFPILYRIYPRYMAGAITFFCVILVLPQLFLANHKKILRTFANIPVFDQIVKTEAVDSEAAAGEPKYSALPEEGDAAS
jgi:hypothetical protein